MIKKQKIIFSQATLEDLDDTFGTRRVLELTSLNAWLKTKEQISKAERKVLTQFQHLLKLNVEGWKEQELALHFIGPVFGIIEFTVPYQFNLFAERDISANLNGIELSGAPDGMIASGYREPKSPFFAFNEYKPEKNPTGDPAGQTLAAMLVGQVLNTEKDLIYGCYIIGGNWYFMVLEGEKYAISSGYNATSDDLFVIAKILKALKKQILKLTSPNKA